MKIKIVKCDDKLMWYSKSIGKEYLYLGQNEKGYLVRDNDRKINIIKLKDGKEIYDMTRTAAEM